MEAERGEGMGFSGVGEEGDGCKNLGYLFTISKYLSDRDPMMYLI